MCYTIYRLFLYLLHDGLLSKDQLLPSLEQVEFQHHSLLEGKNRITDIFKGSADASVLLLTDDSNGDALFVDDVYSALGDQARMSQIDEIRAGAGNDIVDMTSKQYAYEGGAIRIHGGEGDDLLWGSAAGNILFGDAGNDRLAGAGGNDSRKWNRE